LNHDGEFWLSEAQFGAIGPLLPKNHPGREGPTTGGASAASSMFLGCRWQDCPAVYGPSTTFYNRFRRWTMRGTVPPQTFRSYSKGGNGGSLAGGHISLSPFADEGDQVSGRRVLWEDGERVFCRGWRLGEDGSPRAVLVVLPVAAHRRRQASIATLDVPPTVSTKKTGPLFRG
jgi:hypothetical protein